MTATRAIGIMRKRKIEKDVWRGDFAQGYFGMGMSRLWKVIKQITPSEPKLRVMSIVREFTQLEPRPYFDKHRLIAPDPKNLLLTPPTKTFRMSGICGPRHNTTAGITLHLTPRQPDVP